MVDSPDAGTRDNYVRTMRWRNSGGYAFRTLFVPIAGFQHPLRDYTSLETQMSGYDAGNSESYLFQAFSMIWSSYLQTLDTKEKNSTNPITDSGKRGRKAGAIYFPRHPLKEVVSIADAIWTQNAGNPFDILDVAKAIGQSPTSGRFVVRLASSYRYGLTEGSPSTKVVSLTPLGSSIVAPTADTDVKSQQRKALLFSPIFQTVYGWMDRKPIPREDVFRNTLMKPADLGGFGIPREDVNEFIRVFMQNIEDYGLSDETAQGVKYLRLDKLSPTIASEEIPTAEGLRQQPQMQTETGIPIKTPLTVQLGPQSQIPKQIFVAHGKNRKPLDQLERILTRFKVPYKVAQEEPNSGRPVSLKVAELIKQCTSGIFIFTADEETADQQGERILRPSDNVVYELGAASVLYGNKIVIFKEEGVKFASDFGDIGYISFDKDRLDAKAADLMLELITLGFVQLTPT